MVMKVDSLKWVIVFFAEIEMLFFSGIAFGQNSLFPTLTALKYFCIATDHANPCHDQNKYLGYLLITTIISYSLIAVPIGIFYDRFGKYKSKIIGAIFVFLGCLAYALSSVLTQYLAYVAAILLGALTQILVTCNLALTSMFPHCQNIMVSVFIGSLDSSNFVMTFVTIGYRSGISVLASFLILTFVGVAVCCTTASLCYYMEKKSASVSDGVECEVVVKPQVVVGQESDKSSDEYLEAIINARYPNLKSCLISYHYIMQVAYLTMSFFRFSFYLAELHLQFSHLFPGDAVLVDTLLFNSSYVFVCSIVISPFPGIIMDLVTKKIKTTLTTCDESLIYSKYLLCFTPSLFFCTSLNIIMSVLILIPNQGAIYCSFISFMCMRVILFASNGAYLLTAFPKKYFGELFGIGVLVSGAMSFIQYGILFEDFQQLSIVNYILIAVVSLTYIHPILLFVKK